MRVCVRGNVGRGRDRTLVRKIMYICCYVGVEFVGVEVHGDTQVAHQLDPVQSIHIRHAPLLADKTIPKLHEITLEATHQPDPTINIKIHHR